MREIRKSGSMSGSVETEYGELVRHPQTKGRETDRLHLSHRATSRLYPIDDIGSFVVQDRSNASPGELIIDPFAGSGTTGVMYEISPLWLRCS
jgi:tRNA G10  N-methylase Trm11